MAITLEEAKVGMADKVDQQVIDEFRRSSLLLDMLVFDDSISPGTGGSTLQYGYVRLKTPSTCAVRTINTEYAPGHAVREEKTAKAIILGGSFEIDRVIAESDGAVDEVQFQIEEKVKDLKLKLNHKTQITELSTTGVIFLGYRFRLRDKRLYILMQNQTKKRIRRRMKKKNTKNDREELLMRYNGYLSHCHSNGFRYQTIYKK